MPSRTGSYERLEEPLPMGPHELLGVPLHGHAEARPRQLDALDDPVVRARRNAEVGSRVGERLVGEAVDGLGRGPEDTGEAGSGLDRDPVAARGFR